MVLTDSYPGHGFFPGYARLAFVAGRQNRGDVERISAWKVSRQVQPGAYAHTDYDLERPTIDLLTRTTEPRPHAQSHHERFDYPGYYVQRQDGERYVSLRMDEASSQFETANATTNARGVAVGCLLNVVGHPRNDQNREYLVTSATYDLEFSDYESMPDRRGAQYRCRFSAMSSEQRFRPRRLTRKPSIRGVQTAVVVGPVDEEIHADALGRVTVQFIWDRYGGRNEHSSCWVRVSQFWAGPDFGAMFIPRVGQEVIVDFLEGDPDQPVVVGRVYNGQLKPPYAAADAQDTVRGEDPIDAGGAPTACNEIRFEDRHGHEEFFMQAERAMTIRVKGSERHSVGGSRRSSSAATSRRPSRRTSKWKSPRAPTPSP